LAVSSENIQTDVSPEELSTVNDELRTRNAEITQINNDLTNLLASIDIAVVMVGSDLTNVHSELEIAETPRFVMCPRIAMKLSKSL
jgi:hypothetical protein